jgi:hypothetical protein
MLVRFAGHGIILSLQILLLSLFVDLFSVGIFWKKLLEPDMHSNIHGNVHIYIKEMSTSDTITTAMGSLSVNVLSSSFRRT